MNCKKLCVKVQPVIDGIYPQTRHQSCWTHKTANTLNLLCQEPHSLNPSKRFLSLDMQRQNSIQKAFEFFIKNYGILPITSSSNMFWIS